MLISQAAFLPYFLEDIRQKFNGFFFLGWTMTEFSGSWILECASTLEKETNEPSEQVHPDFELINSYEPFSRAQKTKRTNYINTIWNHVKILQKIYCVYLYCNCRTWCKILFSIIVSAFCCLVWLLLYYAGQESHLW